MKRLFAESFLRAIRPLFMIEIDLFVHRSRRAYSSRANTMHETPLRDICIYTAGERDERDAGKH